MTNTTQSPSAMLEQAQAAGFGSHDQVEGLVFQNAAHDQQVALHCICQAGLQHFAQDRRQDIGQNTRALSRLSER